MNRLKNCSKPCDRSRLRFFAFVKNELSRFAVVPSGKVTIPLQNLFPRMHELTPVIFLQNNSKHKMLNARHKMPTL